MNEVCQMENNLIGDIDQEINFVVQALNLGIWRYDLANKTLKWESNIFERYAHDQNYSDPSDFWRACLTPESLARSERDIQLVISGEKEFDSTYELTLPNGETRFVRARATVYRDQNNVPTYLYGINWDVTEEVMRAADNRRLLQDLEEAQVLAHMGSWTCNLQNNELVLSQEFHKIAEIPLDTPKSELYNAYRDRVHPDDLPFLEEFVKKNLFEGVTYELNFRLLMPSGKIKHVHSRGQVNKDASGQIIRTFGICQDRTREVEMEEALNKERAKNVHMAKLASLGEMYAGIAHEINNPLAVIAGSAESLEEYLNNPEEFRRRIGYIHRSVDRIVKIINSLKKISRSGNVIGHRYHDLASLIEESLLSFRQKLFALGIELRLDLQLKSEILCDEDEIIQVVINLISNAIDAVKDLKEKWIEVTLSDQESILKLSVRNSGPKISPEVLAKLFQPFFTTKPVGQGLGLGLSICKGILDIHGAKIEVSSTDPFTCFEIHFPRQQKDMNLSLKQ